jgi:hypothetical protein
MNNQMLKNLILISLVLIALGLILAAIGYAWRMSCNPMES